jgi:hypothetical protein
LGPSPALSPGFTWGYSYSTPIGVGGWGDEKEIIWCYQIFPVFVPPLYFFMIVCSMSYKKFLGIKAGSFFVKK